MRSVSIFGATGSVGTSTLDVIAANPENFSVHTLTAGKNAVLLAEQARKFNARRAVIADDSLYNELKSLLSGTDVDVAAGRDALIDAARADVDLTMNAIVGFAGLEPLLASIANGKNVAIANKEPLVSAGSLVMNAARQSGATLLPVDSEHNAIFQVFEGRNRANITRLILTASGGPFRTTPLEDLPHVTPAQALKHPNWSMGAKLTIDSSTMFNKALEVIEAHHLFAMPPEQIDVVIHPQSIIHSMVEYSDGSVLAQMGTSDMRVPIAHVLGWPERIRAAAPRLDFTALSALTFEAPDECRFPAINLAYDCMREGGAACCAFNAANEVAVAAFLEGGIGYTHIFETVRDIVTGTSSINLNTLENIIAFDKEVREKTKRLIVNRSASNRKVS